MVRKIIIAIWLSVACLSSAVADDSALLNAMLATDAAVKLPCGTFLISSGPIYPGIVGQTLEGSGPCTVLKNTSAANTFVVGVADLPDVSIRNLTIDADEVGTNLCVAVSGSSNVELLGVRCLNAKGGGFQFAQNGSGVGSPYGRISNCYMENIANVAGTNQHAITISLSDYMQVSTCTMKNVDNGVNVAGSNKVSVSGLAINGSGLANSGFAAIRCTGNSNSLSVSGVSATAVPRGLFLLGCYSSSFTGVSIEDARYQPILISATDFPGAPISAPTQGNVISGVTIKNGCNSGGCYAGVEFAASNVPSTYVTNNVVTGVNFVKSAGSITQLFLLNGVPAAINKCDAANNFANLALGSC